MRLAPAVALILSGCAFISVWQSSHRPPLLPPAPSGAGPAAIGGEPNADIAAAASAAAAAAATVTAADAALSRASAAIGVAPTSIPTPVATNNTATAATAPAAAATAPAAATDGLPALPQCSLLFFYHIVKTAGTTMRTVLQRQAQLGDFEYTYTDTTTKPRWQLLVHQLSHRVERRRAIVELHSEWGLPRSFFGDIVALRRLYEPLGCRVTLATMLRHPLNLHLSWFNWRASNYMPLCAWDPPYDPLARQLAGFGLPFVPLPRKLPASRGGRRMRIPAASALSVLRQFDVVGLTERFDESLAALARASGIRHLGYATLAENKKPRCACRGTALPPTPCRTLPALPIPVNPGCHPRGSHPRLARQLLRAALADIGAADLRWPLPPHPSAWPNSSLLADGPAAAARALAAAAALEVSARAGGAGGADAADEPPEPRWRWSTRALEAAHELNAESFAFVFARTAEQTRLGGRAERADCNFYPCSSELSRAKGTVARSQCANVTAADLLDSMMRRTRTDRALHAAALAALEAALPPAAELQRQLEEIRRARAEVCAQPREPCPLPSPTPCPLPSGGHAAQGAAPPRPLRCAALRRASALVHRVRAQPGARGRDMLALVGGSVHARRAEGVVPAHHDRTLAATLDRVSPAPRAERTRGRCSQVSGYDAAEIAAHNYPAVSPIPCWQTCWEAMEPDPRGKHGRAAPCLAHDAPSPSDAARAPGPSCATRRVHCSPACGLPAFGSLKAFWADWSARRPKKSEVGIACPCGHGG